MIRFNKTKFFLRNKNNTDRMLYINKIHTHHTLRERHTKHSEKDNTERGSYYENK